MLEGNDLPPSPAPEAAGPRYWPELDGLRALAFLMVFLFHLGPAPGVDGPVLRFCYQVLGWGWAGVDLFFVLSAFLITYLLVTERDRFGGISFKLFFCRRALRIWPLYYLTLVVGFFLFPSLGLFGPGLGTPEWRELMGQYGLPFSIFMGNFSLLGMERLPIFPLLSAHWSVSMEEQFFIVWCLILLRVARTRTILATLGVALAVSVGGRIWWCPDPRIFYPNTFTHLDPIVVGAVLGTLLARGRVTGEWLQRWGSWCAVGSVGVAFFVVFMMPSLFANQPGGAAIFSLLAAAGGLLLLATLGCPTVRRFFSWAPMVAYGRLTFGLYLFHLVGLNLAGWVLWKIDPWCTPLQYWQARALLGLPITSALAWLSWTFYEGRFNRLRRRLSRVNSGSP